MTITKFADQQILSAEVGGTTAFVYKQAHRANFDHVPRREGYIYVRSRAISSRMNENFDLWPADELRQAWCTFIGKPVFVNHRNQNHRKAKGRIVDAALHEDVALDGAEDVWVEVLMEVDARRYPKLAEAVLKGRVNRTSMGASVRKSTCTLCGKVASNPAQYCVCLKTQKGKFAERRYPDGRREKVLVAEKCEGISFFENSLLVEPPADPTAFVLGVDAGPGLKVASVIPVEKVGFQTLTGQSCRECTHDATFHQGLWGCSNEIGQFPCPCTGFKIGKQAFGETRVPGAVDTLRSEACPNCGETSSAWDGTTCQVCEHTVTPEFLADPDLDQAKEFNREQEAEGEGGSLPEGKTFPRTPKPGPISPGAAPVQKVRGSKEDRFMKDQTFRVLARQQRQIKELTDTLKFVCQVAGLEGHQRVASLFTADADNPAQPIAEPAPEAPAATTQDARAPQATDTPTNVGGTPGIPDPAHNVVKDDPTRPGGSPTPDPAANVVKQDPTKPVAGTDQTEAPKVEGDVRGDDPLSNQEVHEPITLSSVRPMASIRLARLRIEAGIAEEKNDMVLAERISASQMSDAEIEQEINVLAKVAQTATAAPSDPATRHLVPKMAQRQVPSLVPTEPAPLHQASGSEIGDDEMLFEG